MKTSVEIYQRVRWDPRFDATRFVLCIDVHSDTPKKVPLASFDPNGDIPWHRVIAIEADGEIVWDRRTGIDRLDETSAGRRQAVEQGLLLAPPFWSPRSPSRCSREWPSSSSSAGLRVVTWNTLWDRFDSERIDTPRRRALLLQALKESRADVIALQEVEPVLARMLADAPWVQSQYSMSFLLETKEAPDGGLVLLTTRSIRELAVHAFGPHKAVLAMVIEGDAGLPVVVVTVHLTSDRSNEAKARRQGEMGAIASALSAFAADADVILLGDFNEGGDLAEDALRTGMRDAWLAVEEPAFTFDPTANPLAAINSTTGAPGRLDRVLVRGRRLRPTKALLEGTDPAAFPSDHYGVRIDFAVDAPSMDATTTTTTNRTALAWIPPAEAWPRIQAVRERIDPSFVRWPPHVNVVFGFVPEVAFEETARALSTAIAAVTPFDVTLAGVETFAHSKDHTLWLAPSNENAWAELRARVWPAEGARVFRPHLTIGKHPSPDAGMTSALAAQIGSHEANVEQLSLLSRRAGEPMAVRATIDLGTGRVRWKDPEVSVVSAEAARSVDVEKALAKVREHFPNAEVAGSWRLGCAIEGSDLDLFVADLDEETLLLAFGEGQVRVVKGARVPTYELVIDGVDIDVVTEDSSSVTDPDALLALVGEERRESFVELARAVKRWARAKGIDSAPFGGVPSIGWLTLAAQTVLEAPGGGLDAFFAMWAAHEWAAGGFQIMTASPPSRSCTEQVSAAMFERRILEDLYLGWHEPASRFTLAPMHRRHRAFAVVSAPRADRELMGAVRGRMRRLLDSLEEVGEAHAWPRPFIEKERAHFAIGLGKAPALDRAKLETIARMWVKLLPKGIAVEWREAGDVPTLG